MTPLEQKLRERILRDGPIPVADYMAMALGDPDHGYYRHRDPLGGGGDFITAPEVSQVFGELIGLWCAVVWRQMGAPPRFRLVELGPGRGTLMADALRAARTVPDFLAAADIHLVETSEALRARQREALSGTDPAWQDTFDSVPEGPAIVVANEFFDALPVEQYVRSDTGWRLRCVGIDDASGALRFVEGEGKPENAGLPPTAAVGAIFERNPASMALARDIGARLAQSGGAALFIDYGHAESGIGETLQAVAHHRFHDTLAAPGEADLTAHVDFAALRTAAVEGGARAHGPIGQGTFLGRLGVETRTQALAGTASSNEADMLRSGCRRLVDPDQMGALFKALALTHADLPPPPGFEETAGDARCA